MVIGIIRISVCVCVRESSGITRAASVQARDIKRLTKERNIPRICGIDNGAVILPVYLPKSLAFCELIDRADIL